jgi:hypothetical protein
LPIVFCTEAREASEFLWALPDSALLEEL